MSTIIPAPVSFQRGAGTFRPTAVRGPLAGYASEVLGLPVNGDADVTLTLAGAPGESYTLEVSADGIHATAGSAAGLFYAIQTLRQLKANGEYPHVRVGDEPRFAYRGAMLDVARHFFGVAEVKRYIDDIAALKINHLHLHLTDDQGWRIEILSWPNLTAHGSTTSVNGDGGGFYTQADYSEIVEYAASRFITIVPEIDLPGHTNAALASYPELTPDGAAAELYEGIEVGFSTLTIGSERTYEFVRDVLTEVADLTPGPFLHVGGDESLSTTAEDFLIFAKRLGEIGAATGKTLIGWHELGKSSELPAGTIGQYWGFTTPEGDSAAEAATFIARGGQLIMSPADVAYLDMKYATSTPLGLVWAKGPTSVAEAASWEPTEIVPGVGEAQIFGVEAPLWTETLATVDDLEVMAFPRLAAIAQIAWSQQGTAHDPAALETFGERLDTWGVKRYRG